MRKKGWLGHRSICRKLAGHIEVIDLFIDRNFRGKKIGTQLMKSVQDHCKKMKISVMKVLVASLNPKAIEFYKKSGFTTHQIEMFKRLQ